MFLNLLPKISIEMDFTFVHVKRTSVIPEYDLTHVGIYSITNVHTGKSLTFVRHTSVYGRALGSTGYIIL